jgi:putative heme-binding domain-containing protein
VHERAHDRDVTPSAAEVAQAARDLTDLDPFLRHAARIVCERPELALGADPHVPAALIARLHREGAACRADVLRNLDEIDLAQAAPEQLLELLRVYQLVLLRCAPLDEAARSRIAARLLPLFAGSSGEARAELARVLAALDQPAIIDPLLDDLARAATQEEAIHLAHCLLAVKSGWSHPQHVSYFDQLSKLRARAQGGASLVKFIERIQSDALATLPAEERAAFQPHVASAPSAGGAPTPTIHAWTRAELSELLRTHAPATSGGAAAFEKARCSTCHRIAGAGGDTGPDLTGAGARFGTADLIEALLEPSKVISDQYRDVELVTRDGDLLVGRIERETPDTITLRRLPPQEDLIELERADIEERRFHPLSRMPAGSLDVLTADEVRALVDYVLATGSARR